MNKLFLFAVVNWANFELYGAFEYMIRYFGQSATIKLTQFFVVAGSWVIVDFDNKTLWDATRANEYLMDLLRGRCARKVDNKLFEVTADPMILSPFRKSCLYMIFWE